MDATWFDGLARRQGDYGPKRPPRWRSGFRNRSEAWGRGGGRRIRAEVDRLRLGVQVPGTSECHPDESRLGGCIHPRPSRPFPLASSCAESSVPIAKGMEQGKGNELRIQRCSSIRSKHQFNQSVNQFRPLFPSIQTVSL